MTIERISRDVYERTRSFFKHVAVAKSDNKRYAPRAPVGAAKIQRRNLGADDPYQRVARIQSRMAGKTPAQFGGWLHKRGASAAGNCSEMSCVALYYFMREQKQRALPPFPVRYVALVHPGDHAFLIAGYLPPAVVDVPYSKESTINVYMMCKAIPEVAESYVVDVWAGIFCPTAVYPVELMRKMRKWSARGKEVWWQDDWMDPGEAGYPDSLVNSRFYIRDPDVAFE